MKVFFSYSSRDRVRVGEIKQEMESKYGIEVFLAHEDIEPCTEWQTRIISELKTCGAILLFLTPHFKRSKWTDQETGFALARRTKIVPVDAGAIPYGFVGRIQAHRFVDVSSLCKEVFEVFVADRLLKEKALDALIVTFRASDSYITANSNARRLMRYKDKFNRRQKNEIVRYAGQNAQITGGFTASRLVREFATENEGVIDPRILSLFTSLAR
jgi:hypothetical protein